MQPGFHSGAATRPLSAFLWLAMMGCPTLRARGELAAGACAPVLGRDRGGSSPLGRARGGGLVLIFCLFSKKKEISEMQALIAWKTLLAVRGKVR